MLIINIEFNYGNKISILLNSQILTPKVYPFNHPVFYAKFY